MLYLWACASGYQGFSRRCDPPERSSKFAPPELRVVTTVLLPVLLQQVESPDEDWWLRQQERLGPPPFSRQGFVALSS